MTAIATKPRTEPVEAEDPRNALLDAFANQVQALIDNGLEVQIRARLAHLLPAPVLPPPVAPGRLPERESGATSEADAIERELDLAALITACGTLEKFKLSGATHASLARLKTRLTADLAEAKSRRAA